MQKQLGGYRFLSTLFLLTLKGKLMVTSGLSAVWPFGVWDGSGPLMSTLAGITMPGDLPPASDSFLPDYLPSFPETKRLWFFFPSGLSRQSDCIDKQSIVWNISSAGLQHSPSAVQSQLDLLWGANWLAGSGISFIDYSSAVGKHQPYSSCSPEACQFLSQCICCCHWDLPSTALDVSVLNSWHCIFKTVWVIQIFFFWNSGN